MAFVSTELPLGEEVGDVNATEVCFPRSHPLKRIRLYLHISVVRRLRL